MTAPRAPRVLLGAALAAGSLALGAAPAHAEGYRYWSFWERDGREWTYATQGPGTLRPEDGAVLGFRFAVSENSADADRPRGRASFAAICDGTEPRPGSKRIALSVDFGTRADAPPGETPPEGRTVCARVPEDGTAADALAAALKPLRYNSESLLCAIAGYPRSGCGERVAGDADDGNDAADSTDSAGSGNDTGTADGAADSGGTASAGGPSVGLLGGIAVVAVLGAAAVLRARRRRS